MRVLYKGWDVVSADRPLLRIVGVLAGLCTGLLSCLRVWRMGGSTGYWAQAGRVVAGRSPLQGQGRPEGSKMSLCKVVSVGSARQEDAARASLAMVTSGRRHSFSLFSTQPCD